MSNPCSTPETVAGPFPQTLFMGCSVKSFNLNLGWSAEPSTCSVKLAIDPAHHYKHNIYQGFNQNIEQKLNVGDQNRVSTALKDLDNPEANDGNLNLHISTAKKLKDTDDARKAFQAQDPQTKKDDGKVIWKPGKDNPFFYWMGPDPGFLADDLGILKNIGRNTRSYDIMGTMVHFRFDQVIFNGIVKSWGYNNGLIDVQLESPTNLVKGVKIIIKDYAGTISSEIKGATFDGGLLAVPYDDADSGGAFNSTIYEGNIPNLINVFGHKGYQSMLFTEDRGVSLGRVYDGVKEMLSNGTASKFNPFGCIIGKSVRDRNSSTFLHHGISIPTTFGSYTADHWNIFDTQDAIDTNKRPKINLDISEVPRPPDEVYINDVSISLLDFINRCCEPVGLDYWFELLHSEGQYSATIKVHTVSRRFQPRHDVIKSLVQSYDKQDFVIDYKFGQEFQDAKTRSVTMGGKQQRLFQTGTNNLGRYRHRRVYEPSIGSYVSFVLDSNYNYFRIPDTAKTRNLIDYAYYQDGGAVTAQETPNDFNTLETHPQNGQQILRGSYLAINNLPAYASVNTNMGGGAYSLMNDTIKPYFGQSLNGFPRTSYFNSSIGEMFVNISTADLAALFPAGDAPNIGGTVAVSETEIRCAMAGVDSWLNYIFEMPVLGKNVGMSQYIYNYLKQKYGGVLAGSIFVNALNMFSADKGKLNTLPAVALSSAISIENYLPYSEALWPVISNLHTFFKTLGDEHYGQKYLVRLPNITSYIDGNGIRRYNYEVTDKAWEEAGNFIDDTIQIGGGVANALGNEDGTFGPILAFDNSAEFDNNFDMTSATASAFFSPAAFTTKLQALSAQKNPANYYWPLIHDIPRENVFYLPYAQQVVPQAVLPPGTLTINPTVPPGYQGTAHGYQPPDNYKWKMYVRGTTDDVYPDAIENKKIVFVNGNPHCVVSAPSRIQVESPTSLIKTMMEEMLVLTASNTIAPNRYSYLLAWGIAEQGLHVPEASLAPHMGNQQNLPIERRAAHPVFAAVPLKSHTSSYGPWSSHPGLGFQDDSSLFTDNDPKSQINNLVGEVNFQHDPEAVPWNYGGMQNLDDAILVQLKDNNQYQQVLENGSVTMAGVLYKNKQLGKSLVENGPILNSIGVQIGDDGFTTTYTMRTYNRKLGFFNKDSAENIRLRGTQFIQNRQETAAMVKELISAAIVNRSRGGALGGDKVAKGMRYSPMGILVGSARPFLHGNSSITQDTLYTTMDFDPAWPYRPYYTSSNTFSPSQYITHKTTTLLYDEQELSNLLTNDYNKRSMMSLDGIFSPISLYPTAYASTYNVTAYKRSDCPYCGGNGRYIYKQMRPVSSNVTTEALKNSQTITTKACQFCLPDTDDRGKNARVTPGLTDPPSIIIADDDSTDPKSVSPQGAGNKINKYTLNPMIMTEGDFNIGAAKHSADGCGHSIDVVAYGETAPVLGNSLRSSTTNTPGNNFNGSNQRFFGLRGPLMVHGWGYDTEGYPVPNGSGETKVIQDANGKNQVVSITQKLDSNGRITEPYKLNTFYKGWGQTPGCWPVGPVDLRWDENAGVWTVGNQYKNVWVTIEIDLKGTQPTRGTLYNDSASALPEGYRRLVFVKDSSGSYAAPRGASVYCQYDPNSGYYTPLYNQAMVAIGTIQSGGSVEIEQSYRRDYNEDSPQTYVATFKNPLGLGFNVGVKGIFNYINGSWVLTNVK